jgi:protein MpaA
MTLAVRPSSKALAGLLCGLLSGCLGAPAPTARTPARTVVTSAKAPGRTPTAPGHRVFGHSLQGRDLVAYAWGTNASARRVLVVGVVHGDETAGRTIALDLLRTARTAGTELVVVPDLNPDGVARGTRQNARGVDLNRNFPYQWAHLGRPGDQQYSGTGPLSEPESRAMAALVRQLRPTVTVWFHQPIGIVDESGGDVAVERRFAGILGLPLRRLTRYHGSATSWQNTTYAGTTAFVVELPRTVSGALHQRAVRALRDLERVT